MKKITFCLLSCFLFSHVQPMAKRAETVFKKWFEWQQIYSEQKISDLNNGLNDGFVNIFKNHYERSLPTIYKTHLPFLKALSNDQINEYGFRFTPQLDEVFKKNLATLYASIDNDMVGFLNHLDRLGINEVSTDREFRDEISTERNVALSSLLFAQDRPEKENATLFSIANKFFRFCFKDENFHLLESMLLTKRTYPLARFLYTTMWYNLAGSGWKNWSQETLQALKKEADKGKKVVYIAGGSDIYQLIKQGIFTVKNIDPQLPSQPKYYADDWSWIMKGDGPQNGTGDQIIFTFETRKIIMQRHSYQETGETFKARLADGQIVTIPVSKTVWTLHDPSGQRLGAYTLERRFVQQEDFAQPDDTVLLMSFNELFFISLPDFLNGWHIEPSKFPDNLQLYVKQLFEPVSKNTICNMRIASLLNNTDFRFIALGTCIN